MAASVVAVHIPKTAGTSLRSALAGGFGEGLRLDYDDRPLTLPRWQRQRLALGHALRHAGRPLEARCIYGHFLPLKYRWRRGAEFITWLRDPVQRVVSRYHHYLRDCAAGEIAHARWGLVPGLSLEAFCRLPHYQNLYAQYLWGFGLGNFDFIGFVERFPEDLARLAERYRLPALKAVTVNTNPQRESEGYAVPSRTAALIRDLNARDCALYDAARRRFP